MSKDRNNQTMECKLRKECTYNIKFLICDVQSSRPKPNVTKITGKEIKPFLPVAIQERIPPEPTSAA